MRKILYCKLLLLPRARAKGPDPVPLRKIP